MLYVANPDKLAGLAALSSRLPQVTGPPPHTPADHVERVAVRPRPPDDVDFGTAGTVATWTAAGTEVTYCIVTDGDAGGFDDTPRDQMGRCGRPSSGRRPPPSG